MTFNMIEAMIQKRWI